MARSNEANGRKAHRHSLWLNVLRRATRCRDCGTHTGKLLYHHVDPSTKRSDVGKMFSYSHEGLLDEIGKCVVLCQSCHNVLHKTKG